MWPNQKDAIQKNGDLILVDSTFNVNTRYYNAITLVVVVDNKLNSLLGAIAFVRNEFDENYQSFLEFLKSKNSPTKKASFMLNLRFTPQIHSGVSAAIPYCKFIHCAFHLLKDQSLFGSTSGLTDEKKKKKERNKKYNFVNAHVSFTPKKVKSCVSKLYKIANEVGETYPLLKNKLSELITHGINGSRPLQDFFTSNTIPSSRVESKNSLFK